MMRLFRKNGACCMALSQLLRATIETDGKRVAGRGLVSSLAAGGYLPKVENSRCQSHIVTPSICD